MDERWKPPIVSTVEDHEHRREYRYCVYCGGEFSAVDHWKTHGIIQCESCGGMLKVGTSATQATHIVPVLCPHTDCNQLTWVNKLDRLGETKTGCQVCRQMVVVKTDNLGKLTGIGPVEKKKKPPQANLAVAIGIFLIVILLFMVAWLVGRGPGVQQGAGAALSADPTAASGARQRRNRPLESSRETGSDEAQRDSTESSTVTDADSPVSPRSP